jgi:hypothetical protein
VYFRPDYNFYRGFKQWEFVRDKQQHRRQSPHALTEKQRRRFVSPRHGPAERFDRTAAETAHVHA